MSNLSFSNEDLLKRINHLNEKVDAALGKIVDDPLNAKSRIELIAVIKDLQQLTQDLKNNMTKEEDDALIVKINKNFINYRKASAFPDEAIRCYAEVTYLRDHLNLSFKQVANRMKTTNSRILILHSRANSFLMSYVHLHDHEIKFNHFLNEFKRRNL